MNKNESSREFNAFTIKWLTQRGQTDIILTKETMLTAVAHCGFLFSAR